MKITLRSLIALTVVALATAACGSADPNEPTDSTKDTKDTKDETQAPRVEDGKIAPKMEAIDCGTCVPACAGGSTSAFCKNCNTNC